MKSANEIKNIATLAKASNSERMAKKALEEIAYVARSIEKAALAGEFEYKTRMTPEQFIYFGPHLKDFESNGYSVDVTKQLTIVSITFSWK